jgi:hypothetical protein
MAHRRCFGDAMEPSDYQHCPIPASMLFPSEFPAVLLNQPMD